MLLDLLRRDWLLHRNNLLPIFLIFGAFQVWFVLNADRPRFWLVFMGIYASFLTVTPLTRDDKFRAWSWSCTLPIRRTDLVRARYAGAWLTVAGLFLLAFALAVLIPGSKLSGDLPVGPDNLLLAATVVTVILFLVIPFTTRFGILGIIIGLAAIQVLAAVLFVVSKTTGTQSNVEGGVAAIFRPLIGGIGAIRESLPAPAFQLAALLALLLLNWLGYRLTLALFLRREL